MPEHAISVKKVLNIPSRYNFAYSSGSSTASEVKAQSDPGVAFNFFFGIR